MLAFYTTSAIAVVLLFIAISLINIRTTFENAVFESIKICPFSESTMHKDLTTGITVRDVILMVFLIFCPLVNFAFALVLGFLLGTMISGLAFNDHSPNYVIFKLKPKSIEMDKR